MFLRHKHDFFENKAELFPFRLRKAWLMPTALSFQPMDSQLNNSDRNFSANCYSYALGLKGDRHGYTYPGQLRNVFSRNILTDGLSEEAMDFLLQDEDGLIRIRQHQADPLKSQVLACFVGAYDMHFYRMHADGSGWSHKIGDRLPQTHDEDGLKINDPLECERGIYDRFVGFYTVPEDGIAYRY